jgi:hypothetical protein
LVRKRVIVVKNRVEEFKKQYNQGKSGRGYRTELRATAAQKSATNPHHSSIDPSIPPQIAVIL